MFVSIFPRIYLANKYDTKMRDYKVYDYCPGNFHFDIDYWAVVWHDSYLVYEAKDDGPGRTAGRNRLYSRCKDGGSESGAFCKGAERTGSCAARLHGQNGRGHQRTDPPYRTAPSGLPLAACRH